MKVNKATRILLAAAVFLAVWGYGLVVEAEALTSGDYEYRLVNNDSEVEITGYAGAGNVNLLIPSEIEGKPVTSIGSYAFYQKHLAGVIIPDSVTSVGSAAFAENELTSADIGDGVMNIGQSAFSRNQLVRVEIGKNVKSIGNYAFSNNQLTGVKVPAGVTSIGWAVFHWEMESTADLTIYGEDGSNAQGYSNAYGYTFKNIFTVTSINDGKEVEITRYNWIGGEIDIPASFGGKQVTRIGNNAFFFCMLARVTIPDGVKSIGDNAFAWNKLGRITIPDSVTSIGKYAFQNNNLRYAVIPRYVTDIDSTAFDFNPSLTVYGEYPSAAATLASQKGYAFVMTNTETTRVTINHEHDPTSNLTINFKVVFSEPVTGFDGTDVVIGGTAGATKVVVTGSGDTYNVAVSGMKHDGTVTASIKAGAVQDASGKLNKASISVDNTVNYAVPEEDIESKFRDDFNGALEEGWAWIREDQGNWSLANDGYLTITTQRGEIWALPSMISTNNLKNMLLRKAPSGNFEITTKVDFSPKFFHHQAAIAVYQDDDNYIRLGREYSSQMIRYVCETGTGASFNRSSIRIPCDRTTTYLKIVKSGDTYTGYYSGDGENWTKVQGTEEAKVVNGKNVGSTGQIDSHTASLQNIQVGIYACSGLYEAGGSYGQIDAKFDFFEITEKRMNND